MADLYALTESEVRLLKEIVADFRSQREVRLPGRSSPTIPTSNKTYIAKINDTDNTPAGIPGRTSATPPVPGRGYADIYQILTSESPPKLRPIEDMHQYIFNLSSDALANESWVLISLTMNGAWVIGGSGGSSVKLFELTADATGTGSTVPSAAAKEIEFNGTSFSDVSGGLTPKLYFLSAPKDGTNYVAIEAPSGSRWTATKVGGYWMVTGTPARAMQSLQVITDVEDGTTNLTEDKATIHYVGKAYTDTATTNIVPIAEVCTTPP